MNGNVTYVADGDTLDINGIRVRLSLVNTPEKGQAGFQQAKDFVIQPLFGGKQENWMLMMVKGEATNMGEN